MSVHQAPKPFDRVQVWAVGRDEAELDPATKAAPARPAPVRVMVFGIIQNRWIIRLPGYIALIAINSMIVLALASKVEGQHALAARTANRNQLVALFFLIGLQRGRAPATFSCG
jgi:hypothetical protein